MKKKVVIAGFGDTGLLVAIHLAGEFDIVGISPKPCLLSGQELGARLTRPDAWQNNYLMPFSRYKKLKTIRTVQGLIQYIDSEAKQLVVALPDGSVQGESYDVLVIASGVSNGFWRNNNIESLDEIQQSLQKNADRIARAQSIAIIGGGASGVSVAGNVAQQYPDKSVNFFYSQQQPLPGYHPKVRAELERRLRDTGVKLHPHHRALLPEDSELDQLGESPVQWSSGQEPFQADITLWATGSAKPNNDFIDPAMLNEQGFVRTDSTLRVSGYEDVFAVGDIAASDPNRSSARNSAYKLVAHNIRAYFRGQQNAMKSYQASPYRWGSILGLQPDGMRVHAPTGGSFRFPKWSVERLLFPYIVDRQIYKGVFRQIKDN